MTFEEYIKNPMGNKSSVMSNRQMYQQMYQEKWNAIKLRENGLIQYSLYEGKSGYYIHLKIPSEVVPKFYYDTIIRFFIPDDRKDGTISKTLSNYEVQFYSNDPSFVYTFAHAFKEKDLLIKDLEPKMSKLALNNVAKEKNPTDQIGYVKSLYFAYLEIKNSNLFTKIRWDGRCNPYNKKVWINTVTHADDKVRDRQELGEAISKKEKREKNKDRNTSKKPSHSNTNFSSPNIPNFGHFKKDKPNEDSPVAKIQKGIGRFKSNIKHK